MPSRREALCVVARRLAASRMLLDGASIQQAAEAHQLTPATIRKYKARLDAGRLDVLAAMGVEGRSSALDEVALDWIAQALRGPATEHGFASPAWPKARPREVIEKQFDVTCSRVYAWQLATGLGLGLGHRLSKSRK